MTENSNLIGIMSTLWGILGVFILLGGAIYRLTPVAFEIFSFHLTWYHWIVLIGNLLFMAYGEGYRGFQKGFSPRVIARAKYLSHHPHRIHRLFAPLFCMGFFYATKKRRITSLALTLGILCLILLVRQFDRPWRGIIDAGVIIGLLWGVFSLFFFSFSAFFTQNFSYSPEIPLKSQ